MLTKSILSLKKTPYSLPELPYEYDALQPVISKETIEYHYSKHVTGYINALNKLIGGSNMENLNLEEIVCKSIQGPIFNNSAQILNHILYFEQFRSPNNNLTEQEICKEFHDDIVNNYGSIQILKEKMEEAALTLFGSGWVWLVKNQANKLEILKCSNAACPVTEGKIPLLCIDVWEHAYYIDYRNRRADHVHEIWKIINWKKVEERGYKNNCTNYIHYS